MAIETKEEITKELIPCDCNGSGVVHECADGTCYCYCEHGDDAKDDIS